MDVKYVKYVKNEISLAIFLLKYLWQLIVCFLIDLPLDFTLFVHTVINVLGAGILYSFLLRSVMTLRLNLALDYCFDQLSSD